MKPYYQRDGITLYCGKMENVLPQLDAQFGACVTDPPYELGFMGKSWDSSGIAFQASTWAAVLDRLLPGAPLLAFGGSRTYHRIACAIEDGGFEIRDSLMWLYGSGFPKSLDVSKAIDKVTEPAMATSKRWKGYGTGIKPSFEPVVVAMKSLDGTFAANALQHGVAGLNIDGCRIPARDTIKGVSGKASLCVTSEGWDRPWKHDPEAVARRAERTQVAIDKANALGRWPANTLISHHPSCNGHCVEECPVRMLDEQGPKNRSLGVRGKAQQTVYQGGLKSREGMVIGFGDYGGPSRFFYCAKASRAERTIGGQVENNHPTVKPLDVMRWLVRLVTMPDRLPILEPFAGSGTTLLACLAEGVPCVAIEQDRASCRTIAARLRAFSKKRQAVAA